VLLAGERLVAYVRRQAEASAKQQAALCGWIYVQSSECPDGPGQLNVQGRGETTPQNNWKI
jgi:hypothetical protein